MIPPSLLTLLFHLLQAIDLNTSQLTAFLSSCFYNLPHCLRRTDSTALSLAIQQVAFCFLWLFDRLLQFSVFPTRKEQRTWDSLDWSKKYDILSLSRLFLRPAGKFPTQQVNKLTDEDMQRIADMVAAQYDYLDFCEFVQGITATVLEEIQTTGKENPND